MKKYILSLLLLIPFNLFSQCIGVHGYITEFFTGESVKGAQITVRSNDDLFGGYTRKDGFYAFDLETEKIYNIEVQKEGMISKFLVIDTRGVVCENENNSKKKNYYDMDTQITLFKHINNFDFFLFKSPIGWAKYDPSIKNMSWETEYTNKVKPILTETMEEYRKSVYGYYERKKEVSRPLYVETTKEEVKEPISSNIENVLKKSDQIDTISIEVESIKGLFFTVQVGVYSGIKDLESIYQIPNLNSEGIDKGKFRYSSGKFKSFKSASVHKSKIVKLGVKDAFITAYYNGKRIGLKEAHILSDSYGINLIGE